MWFHIIIAIGSREEHQRNGLGGALLSDTFLFLDQDRLTDVHVPGSVIFIIVAVYIDRNYRVITLIFTKYGNYPSVWRIMHYSRYPQFYKTFINIYIK